MFRQPLIYRPYKKHAPKTTQLTSSTRPPKKSTTSEKTSVTRRSHVSCSTTFFTKLRMPNCFACFSTVSDGIDEIPIRDGKKRGNRNRTKSDRSTRYDSSIWALNSSTNHAPSSIATTTEDLDDEETWILNSRFEVGSIIGQGSFGSVYKGVELNTDEPVAVKIERKAKKTSSFEREIRFLKDLAVSKEVEGVPKLFWYGVTSGSEGLVNENHRSSGDRHIVVLTRLSYDLSILFDYCKRQFSLPTVCELGKQMISLIERLHDNNVLHRDVKPHNFVLGYKPDVRKKLHVIDFGLSKYFRTNGKEHLPFRDGMVPIGTARYASIHTHNGVVQSRRDDCESIVYILIYFLRGSLPWQGLPAENRERKWNNIGNCKKSTNASDLCKKLPQQFVSLLNYARSLKFTQRPNYEWMRGQLGKIVEENECMSLEKDGEEFMFDWE